MIILKMELVPLSLWLQLAKAYLMAGMVRQCEHVLAEGTSDEVEKNFQDEYVFERLQICCALASYLLVEARHSPDKAQFNDFI